MELLSRPCRSLCRWVRTRAGDDLFACQGCGSHWRPGAGWTPIDADGQVPADVTNARRAAAAGRAGSSRTSGS